MRTPSTRTVVVGVVTAIWSVNAAAGLFIDSWKPSESVNAIYLVIIGWLFAREAGRRDDEDKE